MNKHSLITKISLFFALFVALILAISAVIFQINIMRQDISFVEKIKHGSASHGITPLPDAPVAIAELEAEAISIKELEYIEKTRESVNIDKPFERGKPKEFKDMPPPPPREGRDMGFESPRFGIGHDMEFDRPRPDKRGFGGKFLGRPTLYKKYFDRVVIFDHHGDKIGFRDKSSNLHFYVYFFASLVVVLAAVSLLYIAILRSLKPLKELEKEIEAFGVGVSPKQKASYDKSEIGKIQKAFYDASAKISGLLDAREIFLKNAAHELKTPVAKGVIVAHMVENEKQKGRLLTIFSSMTAIIEGIMTAEEIGAKSFEAKVEPVLLRPFCQNILTKALIESNDFELNIGYEAVAMADPKLLEIAMTNLFENAVKFKTSGKAECVFEEGALAVKNYGDALEEPIDKYFEPFFKETSIRNEHGMGLGLYLSKKALEIQGLKLIYKRKEGQNIFFVR